MDKKSAIHYIQTFGFIFLFFIILKTDLFRKIAFNWYISYQKWK